MWCRSVSSSTVVLPGSPRDQYQQLVQDGTIDHDSHQVVVVNALQYLHGQLNGYTPITAVPSLLKRVCVCVCVCACVRACVRACVCVCVQMHVNIHNVIYVVPI